MPPWGLSFLLVLGIGGHDCPTASGLGLRRREVFGLGFHHGGSGGGGVVVTAWDVFEPVVAKQTLALMRVAKLTLSKQRAASRLRAF